MVIVMVPITTLTVAMMVVTAANLPVLIVPGILAMHVVLIA